MGIDLVLQRRHAGAQQQALLLFEFDLEANTVPDFQLDDNDHHRSSVDQDIHPARMRAVGVTWHPTRDGFQLEETQSQYYEQKDHLPVAEAGTGLGAANPAG